MQALRKAGCSVASLSAVGEGCPDLLVGARGHNCLLEVKDGSRVPSARKLTPAQEAWHKAWRGKVAVVTTPMEALEACLGLPRTIYAPVTQDRVPATLSRKSLGESPGPGLHLHVGPPKGTRIK